MWEYAVDRRGDRAGVLGAVAVDQVDREHHGLLEGGRLRTDGLGWPVHNRVCMVQG